MELNPASKKFKRCNNNDTIDKLKNCRHNNSSLQLNSLLCLFIEYVWDENNGEYPGCNNIQLIKWLKAAKIDTNNNRWYFSSKLSVSAAPIIQLTTSLKSNENLFRKAQKLNENRLHARLIYALRKVFPTLIASNGDVSYSNNDGQTLLHCFIESLSLTKNFSSTQIYRIKQLMKNLIQRGASLCVSDKYGKTPLHTATMCKNKQILKVIYYFIDVKARDQDGNTALHIILNNCVDEKANHKDDYENYIRNLVLNGADVNAKNNEGVTPVHLSAGKFYPEILKLFVDNGADCCQCANDYMNSLHFACKSTLKLIETKKVLETINLLVSQGCDIEAVDKYQCKPLHYAAEFGTVEVIERLIELGANVNGRTTETQLTPLYLAAKGNQLENMKLLVKAGADVNASGLDGSTPLFMAVLRCNYESVLYLINVGADIYRRDAIAGFTLLHVAAYEDKVDISANISRITNGAVEKNYNSEKLNTFIDKDFNVNDLGFCGILPLHLATIRQNFHNVKILIEHGANINFQADKSEFTALHIATIHSNFEIAKILVDNGADVDCRGGIEQMTPLHTTLAVEIDWRLGKYPAHVEPYVDVSYNKKFWPKLYTDSALDSHRLVNLLLENGANVNIKDASGKTPLHIATFRNKYDIMNTLLKSGALVDVQDKNTRLPLHNVLKDGTKEQLQLLLNYGSDINDDDTCEIVMNSNQGLKIVAIQHAIKRKLVHLPIAKVYEELIFKPVFSEFYKQCTAEVNNLIKIRDATEFSLYEFLCMNTKRQYFSIEKVKNFNTNLEELFPIYAGLIRAVCRYSAERRILLESAKIAWTKISTVYLPEVCVDNILDHLTNRYLEVLTTSVSSDEIILIDKWAKNVIVGSSKCVFSKRNNHGNLK